MSEWQPIETAPKDGTPVHVYGPCPAHGTYSGPARFVRGLDYWRKLHRVGIVNMVAHPTHWQPLPEPPA